MKKLMTAVCILTMLVSLVFTAYAASLDNVDVPTWAGWAILSWTDSSNVLHEKIHRGSKNMTYSFAVPTEMNSYNSYIVSGKAKWGNTINLSYTSNNLNAVLHVDIDYMVQSFYAYVEPESCNGPHITDVTMFISQPVFFGAGVTDNHRKWVCAHEIGHAYGLAHTSSTGHIMYDTYTTDTAHSEDLAGMEVLTHQHTHTSSSQGDWLPSSYQYHQLFCHYCNAYVKFPHEMVNGVCVKCGYGGGGVGAIPDPTE